MHFFPREERITGGCVDKASGDSDAHVGCRAESAEKARPVLPGSQQLSFRNDYTNNERTAEKDNGCEKDV